VIDETRVKKQEKWETPDKLAQSTKQVTLRVALVESTRPNVAIRYPKADGAHRRHDYAPIGLTCSSDYADLEKAVQVVLDDTQGYEKCSVNFTHIWYDSTYVSLLPNFDGTICDMKNNVNPLSAITTTPEFKKALITSGLIVKVGENIDATDIESGSDEDDAPLDIYHLDIVVTVKKKATTTSSGRSTRKKKKAINKIQFNVLNFVVGVPKEENTRDNDDSDDDNDDDDDDDDDDDGHDDDEYVYKIDTSHRGTKKGGIVGHFVLDWVDMKDHVYDPVRGNAIAVYSKNSKKRQESGHPFVFA